MLNTVLRNLISNAVKYTNSNGKVEISKTEDENQVIITVADNGIGMTEQEQNMLFSKSPIQSKTGTATEKGSGIGLTICKDFIEKHDGKIWIESEVNKGSKFIFSLPKKIKIKVQ